MVARRTRSWAVRAGCHTPFGVALCVLLIISLCGCAGYQVGPQSLYRTDIRTVYVPMFESNSYRRGLGQWLTEAVAKEIESNTPFKVVHRPEADSVLTGRIVGEQKRVVTETLFDDPRTMALDFQVQVTWLDRRGDMLMPPVSFPLPPVDLQIGDSAHFAPELGQSIATGQQEAIEGLAKQIVQQMEMRW